MTSYEIHYNGNLKAEPQSPAPEIRNDRSLSSHAAASTVKEAEPSVDGDGDEPESEEIFSPAEYEAAKQASIAKNKAILEQLMKMPEDDSQKNEPERGEMKGKQKGKKLEKRVEEKDGDKMNEYESLIVISVVPT